jgi:hypothetical protein
MQGIEEFGRWNIQEFVARSQDTKDVLTIQSGEVRNGEGHAIHDADLVVFERRTNLPSISEEIREKSQH